MEFSTRINRTASSAALSSGNLLIHLLSSSTSSGSQSDDAERLDGHSGNCRQDRVLQVLVNFLGNAINHSPVDTTVGRETIFTPRGVRFDVIEAALSMLSFQTTDQREALS